MATHYIERELEHPQHKGFHIKHKAPVLIAEHPKGNWFWVREDAQGHTFGVKHDGFQSEAEAAESAVGTVGGELKPI